MRNRLTVEFEDTDVDLCNYLKQNVNAFALEILVTKGRYEGNSKNWLNEEILKAVQKERSVFKLVK